MPNQYDNALEAVRSAVANAAELGLTKPEITHAVSRALHTNNRPRNGHEALEGKRSDNPIDAGVSHEQHTPSGDDEL